MANAATMMIKGLDFKNARKGEGDEVAAWEESEESLSSSSSWWDSGILPFMEFCSDTLEEVRRLAMAYPSLQKHWQI
jgi:hypothetical protein